MELWFLAYSGKNSRNLLVLCLNEDETKYHCLDADAMPEECIDTIKNNWHAIKSLAIRDQIAWLKAYCPAAMPCYKGIYKANCQLMNKFEVTNAIQ